MNEKNPYNIYYMSSIQIDKISGRIFFSFFLVLTLNGLSYSFICTLKLILKMSIPILIKFDGRWQLRNWWCYFSDHFPLRASWTWKLVTLNKSHLPSENGHWLGYPGRGYKLRGQHMSTTAQYGYVIPPQI